MSWTAEDEASLVNYKKIIDSDDIRIKQQIKQTLLGRKDILHVLNNPDLDEDEPNDYFGVNLLPYYIISPTQSSVEHHICYDISYDEINERNSTVKTLEVYFYILCNEADNIYGDTGIARHDLLSALLIDAFNFKVSVAGKLTLVSNVASVVDTTYACRTLIFQTPTDNNLVKQFNGSPSIINHHIEYLPGM